MAVSERTSSASGSFENESADSKRAARMKIDKSGLYDIMQVKRLLDDEVIAFLEEQGYEEATMASNIKIVCGTIAVITALYSHFNKYTFPENRKLIFICVGLYGFCAGLINLTIFFMEGSAFFTGVVPAKARRTTKKGFIPAIWARSKLGVKGSSTYALQLCTRARGGLSTDMNEGYEKYFTTEGRFLQSVFKRDLSTALSNFNSKKSQ